jgi:hypothetical protein
MIPSEPDYMSSTKGPASDKTLQTKHLIPIVLGAVLLSLTATSVLADPLVAGGNVMVGDNYSITTLNGQARAWVGGKLVTGPANLQLTAQVTFVGPHNIVFKVVNGTFQIRGKPYAIDVGHWRGDYNRDAHTSVYQGPATAPDGRQGYFVLLGADTDSTNTGVYTHIVSDFGGEYGVLWHVDLNAFRTKLI